MSTTRIVAHDPEFLNHYEQNYDVYILNKRIFTTVTFVCDNADEWISDIESDDTYNPLRLVVGLDVKLRAPEELPIALRQPLRFVALLVLFVYRHCLVYEHTYADAVPPSLVRFLSNRNNTFVGVGIEAKLAQLQREYGYGGGARRVDLASRAAEKYNRPDLNNAGLSEVRMFFYGKDVERPPVVDVWDEDRISNEHVLHACIDAYVCYELGSYLVFPIKKGKED